MKVSNEKEYWSVGKGKAGDWQLRRTPYDKWDEEDSDILVEVFRGDIKDIKIEFDGIFTRDYSKDHFTFTSEEYPWVFILLNDGRLYVKRPSQAVSEAILIAQSVSQMYPCRGWKSDIDDTLDFGLMVGYIKNGNAYYASYSKAGDTYGWELDFLLDNSGDNTSIKIIRLNDYRMGIQLISESKNRLFITPRMYIGGTFPTQSFKGKTVYEQFTMLNPNRSADPSDYYEKLNPTVTLENNATNTIVRVHFAYPICSIDSRLRNLTDPEVPAGSHFIAQGIDETTGDLLLTLDLLLSNLKSHVKFQTLVFNRIRFKVTDYCMPVLPVLTIETEPQVENFIEAFAGNVSSAAALVVYDRKKKITESVIPQFYGRVGSPTIELQAVRKTATAYVETEQFIGLVNIISSTLEYSYSGTIIG